MRGSVDRGDLVAEPGVADRSDRGRAGRPVVVARAGHPQHLARAGDPDSVSVQFRHEAEPLFWGHHRLDRGGGLSQDLDLFLQVPDPGVRRGQLGALQGRRPGLQPTIDQIALTPTVQRGLGDPECGGHVTDGAPGLDQVQGPAAKLRWIRPRHDPSSRTMQRHDLTGMSAEPGQDQSGKPGQAPTARFVGAIGDTE